MTHRVQAKSKSQKECKDAHTQFINSNLWITQIEARLVHVVILDVEARQIRVDGARALAHNVIGFPASPRACVAVRLPAVLRD